MLQRQIMFKQLQRKQQLQDSGNNRNQNCVNQVSGGQYSPTHNEIPLQDSSRMLMVGNMQMLQHGEPNGPVLSQNLNLPPHFDMSSHDTNAPDSDDNLNPHSQLQRPSNLLVSPLSTNQPAFGRSILSRHNFSSDHVSNQESNLSGQVSIGYFNSGFLSANYSQQEFQKGNENAASLDPLEQKILYNTGDTSWESAFSRVGKMRSGGFESKLETPSLQSGSWSALMQTAVAETSSSDAGIQEEWSGLSFQNPESLTDTEKLQSEWVDRNLQNDSSPSSKPENLFQNINNFTNFQQSTVHIKQEVEYRPESSYVPMQHSPRNKSHLVDNKPQQLFQGSVPSANLWPGEQKGTSNNDAHQQSTVHIKQEEEYRPESSYATMQHFTRNKSHLVDNKPQQLFQGSVPSTNLWPGEQKETSNNDAHHPNIFSLASDNLPSNNFSGHGFGGSFWLRGKASGHVSNIQNKYDQMNQMKSGEYSVEPENMAHVGVSTVESVTPPSENMFELLYKDDHSNDQTPAMQPSSKVPIHGGFPDTQDFGFRMRPTDHLQTPQSHSFSQSLSGNSSATSPHITSDYMKNLHPQSVSNHRTTQFPAYSAAAAQGYSELKISDSSGSKLPLLESIPEHEPSLTPDMLQHSEFQMGLPTPWPENHNTFRPEYQRPAKGNSSQDGSNEINNSTSLSINTHNLDANIVKYGSLLTNQHNHTYSFPARDIGDFHHAFNQNYSHHQALSTRNVEDDNVNNQHSIANARKLLSSGFQSGVKGKQLDAFWSGKASSMPYNQNPQQADTSSLTYQSHIGPQMVPPWFKHNETMNGHILPMYDPRASANASQSFGEVTLRNMRGSSSIIQTNASQVGGVYLSTASPSIACKQLNSPYVFPSDGSYGNLAVSVPKKRKFSALDMVPWHKEVNHEQWRLQDISTTEYLWAEASNRKPEEATNEAENVEELRPAARAKRRLISTTQLMQQVLRPLPRFLLCPDASPNCDSVVYFAARLALGDAWSLTGQLPSETNNMPSETNNTSPDDVTASKRTKACKFSKVAEAFIDRVKKVESDISRLDKSLSLVDVKLQARELLAFSTINRLSLAHTRPRPVNADSPSSSISTALLENIQKSVVQVPASKVVPLGEDCISL